MTEPDGRYGEEVRRALMAAADLVVPAGDGLERIQQRTARRPPLLAWLTAYGTYLPRRAVIAVQVLASEIAAMATGHSSLRAQLRAGVRRLRVRAGPAHAWLRPALAAAGALILVIAITLAIPRLRQAITPSALTGGPGGNTSSTGYGGAFGAGRSTAADSQRQKTATTTPNKAQSLITMPAYPSAKCENGSSGGGSNPSPSPSITPVDTSTPSESPGVPTAGADPAVAADPDSQAGAPVGPPTSSSQTTACATSAPSPTSPPSTSPPSTSPTPTPSPSPSSTSPSPSPSPSTSPSPSPSTSPSSPATSAPPDTGTPSSPSGSPS